MPTLKILIVCEHASDTYGGEAILPLNYFRCLAKTEHQVYLITHARVAASLSQCGDIQQDHVFYVPDTMAHKFLNKLSKKLPQRLSVISVGFLIHLLTQFYQWKLVRKIIKEKQIDIVHEPAPVSATLPSAMFALGLPVIIGPMNGGMTFPPAFQYMAGWSERILYKIIRAISSIYNLIIPGKFLATMLLVANDRTRKALPKLRLGKVITLVENGVFSCLNTPKAIAQLPVIHVLYVGRLIDLKMIDVAIEAVAKCADNIKLTILGDGPLRRELEHYVQINGSNKVEMLGAVPHAKINQYYDNADIFVLPSVRECGGAVVLEAMSRGIPVIAVNWGGPADYVTADTGFLIEPKSREYIVGKFAEAISLLASRPELRHQMGKAAIIRIKQHFLWDKKVGKMVEIYQQAIQIYSRHKNTDKNGKNFD
jgi:glycosyltransferase involved in cell wall biosynthesis